MRNRKNTLLYGFMYYGNIMLFGTGAFLTIYNGIKTKDCVFFYYQFEGYSLMVYNLSWAIALAVAKTIKLKQERRRRRS